MLMAAFCGCEVAVLLLAEFQLQASQNGPVGPCLMAPHDLLCYVKSFITYSYLLLQSVGNEEHACHKLGMLEAVGP